MNIPACSATGMNPLLVLFWESFSSLRQASNEVCSLACVLQQLENIIEFQRLVPELCSVRVRGIDRYEVIDPSRAFGCAVAGVVEESNRARSRRIEARHEIAHRTEHGAAPRILYERQHFEANLLQRTCHQLDVVMWI